MSCAISRDLIEQTETFHGHSCPGLAIGIRAAELVHREFGNGDEADLVAVVEADMCAVDAIQYLTSCTYGKGNLIHKDYGKVAFSFYDRTSGRKFRALLRPEIRSDMNRELGVLMRRVVDGKATAVERARNEELREILKKRLLGAELEEVFTVSVPDDDPPRPARVLTSLMCEECGEMTMESRTRRFDGKTMCLPCFNKVEQKV